MSTLTEAPIAPDPVGSGKRPRRRNGWLVAGGIITAIVLTISTLTVASWLGYRADTEQQTYRAMVADIAVELDMGDLIVVPGGVHYISVTRRITWSYQRPHFTEQWDGHTLRISTDCGFWPLTGPHCGVTYTLAVPADVAVRARTSTGDIVISDIHGGLHLTTTTGDIRVTGVDGPLQLHTSTGDITAMDITSPNVEASTDTGDIDLRLAAAPYDISAHTTLGDVSIVVPEGEAYRVDADTGIGDERITVQRSETGRRPIVARSTTGNIDIRYG